MDALSEFVVPREQVSLFLNSLGVALDTTLAPAMILAATDMLVAANLAQSLPEGVDYMGAVRKLGSFSIGLELPEPVLLATQLVYQELRLGAEGLAAIRLKELGHALGI
jgi:hypothetical protein